MSRENHDMTQMADAAFLQAARDVVERACHTKTPIIIWENGAVKKVPYWRFKGLLEESPKTTKSRKRATGSAKPGARQPE